MKSRLPFPQKMRFVAKKIARIFIQWFAVSEAEKLYRLVLNDNRRPEALKIWVAERFSRWPE